MQIAFYYDLTWAPERGGTYTNDAEGQLVQLCRRCARAAGHEVAWAGAGDELSQCEGCDATATAPVMDDHD
jgi:hypothetical protein